MRCGPCAPTPQAPVQARGALNILFQLATTTGVLTAQLVNYALRGQDWGWRLSLGLACGPAALLALGGAVLPDSPASLMERGRAGDARSVLQRVRGTKEVDAELADIADAAAAAAPVTQLQARLRCCSGWVGGGNTCSAVQCLRPSCAGRQASPRGAWLCPARSPTSPLVAGFPQHPHPPGVCAADGAGSAHPHLPAGTRRLAGSPGGGG